MNIVGRNTLIYVIHIKWKLPTIEDVLRECGLMFKSKFWLLRSSSSIWKNTMVQPIDCCIL